MNKFLTNPLTYILYKLGYEVVKSSPIKDYLIRFTHSSYFQDRMNNNDLERFKYKLYSEIWVCRYLRKLQAKFSELLTPLEMKWKRLDLISSFDVSQLGYPELTNVARYYSPFELFFYLDPAQRPFSYCPFIIMAPTGTSNRKGKKIPLECS